MLALHHATGNVNNPISRSAGLLPAPRPPKLDLSQRDPRLAITS
jgi:hypothetical protein